MVKVKCCEMKRGAEQYRSQPNLFGLFLPTLIFPPCPLSSSKLQKLCYQLVKCLCQNCKVYLSKLGAKIHFMVLTLLKFQNVNWFIRNTDFPVKSFWKISDVFRPKTPPTTPRSLFWHINCDVPKWKIINMLLDGYLSHDI